MRKPVEAGRFPASNSTPGRLLEFVKSRAVWPYLLLGYAPLAWYRFQLTTGAFRNSDDSGNFLAGVEMAEGNWRLAGWVMAPDNYYPTDVLGQAVLRLLFGYHPIFMMLWEALVWGGVAWLGTCLACAGRPAREWLGIMPVVLAMLAFNVFDHTFADGFYSTIASHGSTIALTLAAIGLASPVPCMGVARRALLCGVVTVGCFSDPIFNVIACLPIIAVAFLGLGDRANARPAAWCIFILLCSMAVARMLVILLAWAGGFESVHLSVALASFPDLLAHIAFAAESIPRLLGANFFGRALGQTLQDGPYIQLLRAPLVLALAVALCSVATGVGRRVRDWPGPGTRAGLDDLDHMLWTSTVLCVASACMTTVIEDQSCARFFLPAVVTGSVLTARLLGRIRLVALYTSAVLAASAVFGLIALPAHETPRSTAAIPQVKQIVDVLRQHGLQHGYAGYWESTIVTALARREITSLPLSVGPDGQLHPFRWLANLDWFAQAAHDWHGRVFFVTASQPGGLELSEAEGRRQFGTPKYRIDLGQFVIYVFDARDPGFHAPTA